MKIWVAEFYKARIQEGMNVNEVDKMDFRYFMKLLTIEDEKKAVEEKEKFKHVYIDDLNIF
jgi:hypothetical protein